MTFFPCNGSGGSVQAESASDPVYLSIYLSDGVRKVRSGGKKIVGKP